jgi:hypothetical protein
MILKKFIVLTSSLLLLSSAALFADDRGIKLTVITPKGNKIDLYRESYALIVGNSDYTHGWDPIPGAIRDVNEVAKVMEKHGFKVTLKTNLTKDDFYRVLSEFSLRYGKVKDNRLFFYYAGHGFTQKMATGDELGYLVMVNAPLPEEDLIGFSLSSVDMQSLITQAKIIRARHVLFMFDSCFSGSIINMRERVVPRSISDSVKYPVRQFITAGRANEPVPDQSVFKQAFLDLIEGRDSEPIPDHYITGEELGLYLKTKVPRYNPSQHPQYGKIRDPRLDKGDFVFALKLPVQSDQSDLQQSNLEAGKKRLTDDALLAEQKQRELEEINALIEKKNMLLAEVQRLEIEKKTIEEKKHKQAEVQTQKNEKQELAYIRRESHRDKDAQSPLELPYKIAIFPGMLQNDANFYLQYSLSKIIDAIKEFNTLNLKSSFYKLDTLPQVKTIDSSVINSSTIDKLWVKKSFFHSYAPNIDLIRQIGRKLKVDAALMLHFDLKSSSAGHKLNAEKIIVYLIDVRTGKLFTAQNKMPITFWHGNYNDFMDELNSFLLIVLDSYLKEII